MLDILKVEQGQNASQEFKVSQRRQSSTSMKPSKLSSVVPLATSNRQVSSISPRDEDSNDEMIEVTPEVQMFIGNHFMSDMLNGGSGNGSVSNNADKSEDESQNTTLRLKKASNLLMAEDSDNSIHRNGLHPDTDNADKASSSFLCRLCGRSAPSSAALFAHLLYPHYAHLWRTEIPHRANQYLCKQCPYSTTKRQHFVQHVAKVHEDLKKKLLALGENIEILDNLNPNGKTSTERIISKVAKFKTSDDLSYDENLAMSASEYSNVNSPVLNNEASESAIISTPKESSKSKLELSSFGLIPGRFPRGYKPFVKCRLCGKGWKGKDNFFTHLVSTHFKHMWSAEVPKHADMFHCHVGNCQYQSKYRYNFLFHLAGKHKQLKEKLAKDGISLDVLVPIEVVSSIMISVLSFLWFWSSFRRETRGKSAQKQNFYFSKFTFFVFFRMKWMKKCWRVEVRPF